MLFIVDVDNDGFKVYNSSGTLIDPATDAVVQAVRDRLGEISATPTANTIQDRLKDVQAQLASLDGKDFATQTTLATLATQTTAAAIQTVLEAIRDTAGIKKITDALPAGANRIGAVRLLDILDNGINSILNNAIRRLESRASITSPDGALDVAVIADNSINRFECRSSIVGQAAGAGAEQKITTVDDVEYPSTMKRLQTEARLAPGSTVNIGTSIPADPANLVIEFLEDTGGGSTLLVDGSGTIVDFTYAPPAGVVLAVQDLLIVFAADDFSFDGASFGPNLALTNGALVQLYTQSALTDLFTIKQNEDFLRIPGRIPVINNTGPKDLLSGAFSFGGLVKLDGDTSDYVRIRIQDDLTSTKLKYFTATIYGAEI